MPTGRPSEYKEEYVDKVDEYLATRKDSQDKVNLPTIEGFALFLDVSKKSLYNWRDENEDFLHALDKIIIEQHNRLVDNGLQGRYNSTIAKLMLSSNHGMRERSDVTSEDKRVEGVVVLPTKDDGSVETPPETVDSP